MSDVCPCSGISPCGDWLSNFISGVNESIDSTAGYSLSYSSGWVLAPQNLGKLNNLIDTDFELICLTGSGSFVTGYQISPCMDQAEQGIYAKLREYEFYNTQSRWAMSGVGGLSANSFTNIKEWNRSISVTPRVEIVKQFRELAREAKEDLQYLVKYYLKYHAIPASVDGSDTLIGYYGGAYGAYGAGGYGGYGGDYPYGYNPRNWPQA